MNLNKNIIINLSRYLFFILIFIVSIIYAPTTYSGNSIDFTVASCNVLQQSAYEKHPIKGTDPKLMQDLTLRQHYFDESPLVKNTPDIIALQEYYENDSPNINLSTDLFYVQQQNGLYLASNKNIFNLQAEGSIFFETTTAENFGFLYQILTPIQNPQKTVGIINAHLRGSTPAPGNAAYIKFIAHLIEKNPHTNQWIIMGDFNSQYDGTTLQKWIDENKLTVRSTETTNYDNNQKGKNKLVKFDYILSKNIQRSNDTVYPNTQQQMARLLTHSNKDATRDYFSDHAILMATFTIDTSATQLPPQALSEPQKLEKPESSEIQPQLEPQPLPEPPVQEPAQIEPQLLPEPQSSIQIQPVLIEPELQQPQLYQTQSQQAEQSELQPKPKLQQQQTYQQKSAPKTRKRKIKKSKKQKQPVYQSEQQAQQQYLMPTQAQPITTQAISNRWVQQLKAAIDREDLEAIKRMIPPTITI